MNLTWIYILALYAIGVWRVDIPRRIALLFYLLVLVYLWRPLTQDVTIIAGDVVRLAAPWSELYAPNRPPVSKFEVSNANLQDVTMQIAPWAHQVREAWRSGEIPLWNAAAGCGYPLLANGQSTPLSPLRLLTLPLPFAYAYTAECALKLLLALTLMFLFCRRRYSMYASVLAAIGFSFSTWMLIWLQFPIAGASALLPGVLLAIDLLIERVTRKRFAGAALMFAVTVFTGQPETVFQVGLFAGAYGLWVALIEKRQWRALLPIAGASLVAAVLASPFLVPFAEAALRSQRLADVRETPEMTISPLPAFDSAVLLLQPRFFGHLPVERPWAAVYNESICGFAGVLAIVCAIAAAIFIVRERRWRERETLYLLALIFSVAVVLGTPVITEVFHKVAGMAPNGRMRFGICFFAALLIAPVVDWTRRESRVPLLIGTLAVAATMFALLRGVDFPTRGHYDAAVYALFPSIAMLLAIPLSPLRGERVRVRGESYASLRPSPSPSPREAGRGDWGIVLGIFLVIDLWLAASHWDPRLPSRALYPQTLLIAALEKLPHDNTRILGIGSQLYPNTSAMYGLDDVRVHDPMALHSYETFLQTMTGWEPRSYYEKWTDTETPVIDFLNARYVITEPARELAGPRYEQRYAGRDGRIYENRNVLPLFFGVRQVLPGGELRTHTDWRYTAIVSRLPRRFLAELSQPWTGEDARVEIARKGVSKYTLRIHAPRTTLIVSSIANAPGWRAGDFPVVNVNGPFLGFVVPRGEHVVDVVYRPLSFFIPAILAAITLVVMSVMMLRARPPQNDIGT
ncbi:MAG: YfhO family protein [Thermoanaerobaculia bacterium]